MTTLVQRNINSIGFSMTDHLQYCSKTFGFAIQKPGSYFLARRGGLHWPIKSNVDIPEFFYAFQKGIDLPPQDSRPPPWLSVLIFTWNCKSTTASYLNFTPLFLVFFYSNLVWGWDKSYEHQPNPTQPAVCICNARRISKINSGLGGRRISLYQAMHKAYEGCSIFLPKEHSSCEYSSKMQSLANFHNCRILWQAVWFLWLFFTHFNINQKIQLVLGCVN